jgi:ElaB protein
MIMTNSRHAAHNSKDILDDLRALVADAEKMIGDSVSDNSDEVVNALRARYDAVQERLSEVFDGARKKAVVHVTAADDAIRGNPYSAIAIAAIAGVLAGVLVGRRGRR